MFLLIVRRVLFNFTLKLQKLNYFFSVNLKTTHPSMMEDMDVNVLLCQNSIYLALYLKFNF